MKIDKVVEEINKLKVKISEYQTRLRDLERQKTEMENAEIVSMVRGIDVAPDELRAFIEAYKKQAAIPQTSGDEQNNPTLQEVQTDEK